MVFSSPMVGRSMVVWKSFANFDSLARAIGPLLSATAQHLPANPISIAVPTLAWLANLGLVSSQAATFYSSL
jgi:hypothetical protein